MPQPNFLQQTIAELSIGTYDNIRTITTNTHIAEALNMFVTTRVSALPVVDADQKLVNIYSKFDVIDLAAEKTYTHLNIPVVKALEYRSSRFDGVSSCLKTETLGAIMERIVKKEVHRLVVVDEHNRVQGILSLSDILTFIVLKQDSQFREQLLDAKTTSITSTLGLTRLSPAAAAPTTTTSSNNSMNESSASSSGAGGGAAATVNTQPMSSAIDQQGMFEDDHMETEPIK
jgi:CBS domain-containing protein